MVTGTCSPGEYLEVGNWCAPCPEDQWSTVVGDNCNKCPDGFGVAKGAGTKEEDCKLSKFIHTTQLFEF